MEPQKEPERANSMTKPSEDCSTGGEIAPPKQGRRMTTELEDETGGPGGCFHSFRYIIIVLSGVMMGSMLFLRVNITVAMISMVNKTAIYLSEHPNSTADDYFAPDYFELGEFVWNNEIQQIIMTGYMVAYTIPQVLLTKAAMHYGVRSSMALSLSLCAIASLLTPSMAYWGWQWAFLLRSINALGASAIVPSLINVIEDWTLPGESAQGLAIFLFTANVMYTFTPLISGYLTSLSWKLAFYVPGAVGLVICCVWYTLASDSPESSKFISQREYNLINGLAPNSRPSSTTKQTKQAAKERPDLPWYFMFKIKEFYFITLVWILHCSTSGGFLFLLPTYLNRVLSVPVEEVGLMNFTVQIGHMFSMLWPSPLSTFLQNKFDVSLTTSRRIAVSITAGFTVATYCYLGAAHDNLIITIALNRFFHATNDSIVLATVMSQYGKSGLSGLVYSMVNAIGNFSTVVLCWSAGRALDYTGETLECWSWILYSLSAAVATYFLIYLFTCKSEPIEVSHSPTSEIECGLKPAKQSAKDKSQQV